MFLQGAIKNIINEVPINPYEVIYINRKTNRLMKIVFGFFRLPIGTREFKKHACTYLHMMLICKGDFPSRPLCRKESL